MTPQGQIPEEIASFCQKCSKALSKTDDINGKIEYVRQELPGLSRNRSLFTGMVRDIVDGAKYPDLRQVTMFDNEVLLFSDPDHLYSLRLFFWEQGEYTRVHDHGSWGVIGPITGELEAVNYAREDDGSNEAYARLVESERLKLQPSETAFTLPLDKGIHKVGNPTTETMVSLSLYGNAIPRGYINGFEIETGRVYRILPPKTRKKLLAMQALPGLDGSVAREALTRKTEHPVEIFRTTSAACLEKLS